MNKMNETFQKYRVYVDPNAEEPVVLKWSESTSLRHLHAIKLEYGCNRRGYCDGHEREDVVAARKEFIDKWYALEPRMHLWCKAPGRWVHVDDFKFKGAGALDRNDLPGELGSMCKEGVEYADDPNERPLLVFAQDETAYLSKKCNAMCCNELF